MAEVSPGIGQFPISRIMSPIQKEGVPIKGAVRAMNWNSSL